MAVNDLIIFRKGTSEQWNSANPILASGEPGYDLTNEILKIGDGSSVWTQLSGVNQNIVAGYDISITSNSGIYTIASTNLVHVDSKQPQGFINRTDSRISVSGNIFTIAPTGSSYSFYNQGIKVTKTSGESLAIPNLTQINYIHFDTINSQLSNKTTGFDFSTDIPIAYVAWNSGVGPSGQMTFFAEERHGIVMDTSTHKWIHNTFGAQYVDGLSIGNYVLGGNGTSNSHATISIGNGTLYQEDIEINITDSSSTDPFCQELSPIAQIPVYYHEGSTGQWVKNTATNYPVKYGANGPQYNLLTGGVWTTPDVSPGGQNRYFAVWILATNQIDDPIISIMGQRIDNNQGPAENNNLWSDVNLTNLPLSEVKPLYRLIFAGDRDYTNAPKCSLHSILDIRAAVISTIAGVSQNDHGSLFGLGDDDHYQYVHIDNARTIDANHTFTNGLTSNGLISSSSGNFTNSLQVNGTGVSLSGHTHTSSNITDFNSSVSGLLPVKNITPSSYIDIVSSTGNFTISVTGLQPSGSYAASSHTHTSSNITDFNSSVSGLVNGVYAPLTGTLNQFSSTTSSQLISIISDETGSGLLVFNNSPAFTGAPLVPTANSGTNTNQIASTSFVRTEISNLVNSAPSTLDTLNELAIALGNDANFSTTITNSLASKANLSGSIFTGAISGPSGDFTILKQNGSIVSVTGHTHVSSDITNFNSSVSGLLPVKNIVAGDNITISSESGIYTINSTGSGSSSSNVGVRGIISTTGTLSSFSVSGGYPVGYLDLFQDGIKLVSDLDFSATDGSNISLNNSVPSGTVLEYLTMASGVSTSTSSEDSRWDFFKPPAPTGIIGSSGNTQVVLSWNPPNVLSQTPITDYVVQYSTNSGSTWTTFSDSVSTSASVTITGLSNGTPYVFRVAGVNGIGQGPWSSASASVTPNTNVSAQYLLVGGGGGGGGNTGGGGGGGQVLSGSSLSLISNETYTVTVGSGGTTGTENGGNGSASTITGSFVSLSASGGGGGGGLLTSTPADRAGASVTGASGGGAGGGGGDGSGSANGGTGAYAGGTSGSSPSSCTRTGGGGGGAGAAGGNASGYVGGNGGVGIESLMSGESVFYGGGGGGAALGGGFGCPGHTAGVGGTGGGGSGSTSGNGVSGTPNTGGGGGGGTYTPSSQYEGGSGGSGIVIIRVADSITAASTTGSPSVYTGGGYRYYKFTTTGSITF